MLFVTLTMDSLTYGMVCVVDESSGKTMPMSFRVSLPDHLMVVWRRALVARVDRTRLQIQKSIVAPFTSTFSLLPASRSLFELCLSVFKFEKFNEATVRFCM